MESYEKNVDKAVNVVEKVGNGLNRLYIGCLTIFANLFFMAFCLWGAYAATVSWRLQAAGEITTGTVVRLEESKTDTGACCVYSPVVEYEIKGQAYSFENEYASDASDYKVGGQVKVRYDPLDPATAQIDTISQRWLFPIIIIPAMFFAALLVNFFMIRAWRRGEDLIGETFQ